VEFDSKRMQRLLANVFADGGCAVHQTSRVRRTALLAPVPRNDSVLMVP
jgi:hypothetical protein